MIASQTLKERKMYLDKIVGFKDTDPVKIITGIRRSGKSSLLKLMIAHLKENGINDDQIVEMNFESFSLNDMSAKDVYNYVKERLCKNKRT